MEKVINCKIRNHGIFLFAIFVFVLANMSYATVVTYVFDPNDWVTNYNTDINQTRLQQDNPRILIDGVYQSTDKPGYSGIHTTYAGAAYSSTGIAGFANQVPNVEIHDFNMWLADGLNAPNWGEVLTQVIGSTPSGTATNGWAAYTFDNPWPQAGYGTKLVGWYDIGYWDGDPNTAANPLTFGTGGINFGDFTMTVDLNTTDVYGNPVDFNAPQTIWLGTMLPIEWTTDPADLVYANNYRFEGTMKMHVIPEPSTVFLIGIGLVGFGFFRKKFKR